MEIMKSVDIGILRSPEIVFALVGNFSSAAVIIGTWNTVSVKNGKLLFNGVEYESISFVPSGDDSRFTLHDVVIGVGFHWQRLEDQTFKGELRFIVEDGEVRAINRIAVEDYLVSVISSEMSSTSSLELLKAHAVISRSWLYAQLHRKNRYAAGILGRLL